MRLGETGDGGGTTVISPQSVRARPAMGIGRRIFGPATHKVWEVQVVWRCKDELWQVFSPHSLQGRAAVFMWLLIF